MKKYQLPKEFAEKWVAALRSGEYKQGSFGLYRPSNCSYCCLGVACVLAGQSPENIIRQWIDKPISGIPDELIGNGGNNDLVHDLSEMNDHDGKTFPEIADWIESNVEFV